MLPAIYDFWQQAFEAERTSGSPGWAHTFSFLNLFQYITFRAAFAGLLAFVLSVIFGPRVIRKLISMKLGQPIRSAAEVHKLAELHGGKLGTPTMRELHDASGGGLLTTATHKRVMRLAQWGVVKIIEGRPQRVKLARN